MFSKASWLERVHHNGGKAIYSDAALPRRAMPKRVAPIPKLVIASEREVERLALEQPAVPLPSSSSGLEALLATAKAYRPLAMYILREIDKAVPDTVTEPAAAHVSFSDKAREFAVLALGSRDLRLGLTLEGHPFEPPLQTPKFPNPAVRVGDAITHRAVLNDVRQVDSRLIDWIIKAAG